MRPTPGGTIVAGLARAVLVSGARARAAPAEGDARGQSGSFHAIRKRLIDIRAGARR